MTTAQLISRLHRLEFEALRLHHLARTLRVEAQERITRRRKRDDKVVTLQKRVAAS